MKSGTLRPPINHRVKYKPIEVGDRFGRLVITAFAGSKRGSGTNQLFWLCKCDCGTVSVKRDANLKNKTVRSCGCLQPEIAAIKGRQTLLRHGEAVNGKEAVEYSAWRGMFRRIDTPQGVTKRHYGDRGIQLCKGWRGSYKTFLKDMGRKPSRKHSLDRKNNDGHYSCGHCEECKEKGWPANCRWATPQEQARNRRQRNGWTGPAPIVRVAA